MTNSPKPDFPPPKAYEPPSPPSQRDLGPPPPGYGRYADFERGYPGNGPPGAGGTAGPPGPRRNLEDVTCFKVSSAPRIPQSSSHKLALADNSAEKEAITRTIATEGMYPEIGADSNGRRTRDMETSEPGQVESFCDTVLNSHVQIISHTPGIFIAPMLSQKF